MAIRVEIHSTAKRVFQVVGFTLALCGLALGLRYLRARTDSSGTPKAASEPLAVSSVDLTPVVSLPVPPGSRETVWSTALAKALGGVTEAPVQSGRVDVLTSRFAIEVERLEKWHEGIGQALHYSDQTGRLACIALIVEDGNWPISPKALEFVKLIEDTSQKRQIRVVLLRRETNSTPTGTR